MGENWEKAMAKAFRTAEKTKPTRRPLMSGGAWRVSLEERREVLQVSERHAPHLLRVLGYGLGHLGGS